MSLTSLDNSVVLIIQQLFELEKWVPVSKVEHILEMNLKIWFEERAFVNLAEYGLGLVEIEI